MLSLFLVALQVISTSSYPTALCKISDEKPLGVSKKVTLHLADSRSLFNHFWALRRALALHACCGVEYLSVEPDPVASMFFARTRMQFSSPFSTSWNPTKALQDCKNFSMDFNFFSSNYFHIEEQLRKHSKEQLRRCVSHHTTLTIQKTTQSFPLLECEEALLEPLLARPQTLPKMTIYLRSGDIMHKDKPHRLYGQPPMDWYNRILYKLSREERSNVVLMSQDRDHELFSDLLHHKKIAKTQVDVRTNFTAQLEGLLSSQVIVLGRSTMTSFLLPHLLQTGRKIFVPYKLSRWSTNNNSSETNCSGATLYGLTSNHTVYPLFDSWTGSSRERKLMHTFQFEGEVLQAVSVVT